MQKKCPGLDAIYIKSISYDMVNDEQKYTTLLRKLHSQNCDFSSQISLIRFNFQNNHENPNSEEPYYSPQSGHPSSDNTIFRGLNCVRMTSESCFEHSGK